VVDEVLSVVEDGEKVGGPAVFIYRKASKVKKELRYAWIGEKSKQHARMIMWLGSHWLADRVLIVSLGSQRVMAMSRNVMWTPASHTHF